MTGRRLRPNPSGITGLSILQPVVLSAVLAPVTAPHDLGRQHPRGEERIARPDPRR